MRILIIGLVCGLLASCSSRTTLSYEPILEQRPVNSVAIKLLDFKDSRHAKDLVGHFRNEYGIPSVKLVAKNDVAKWATNALRMELERSGYRVGGYGSDVKTVIHGEIYDVYCDAGGRYNGRLEIKVRVKQDGKVVFKKKYLMNEDNGHNWINSSKSSAKALELNLQIFNREFVDDLSRIVFAKEL